VPAGECVAKDAHVLHAAREAEEARSAPYSELLLSAAALTPQDKLALKASKDWGVLGTSVSRGDIPAKVDGSALFGIDVKRPDLLIATVLHAPTFGGTLESVDDAPAYAINSVRRVVHLKGSVAVVADGYWAALQGARALNPTWTPGPNATLDSAQFRQELLQAARDGRGRAFPSKSSTQNAKATARSLHEATQVIDLIYDVPFLAQAPMEPLNATVEVTSDAAHIWLSTQSQADTQRGVAKALGLEPDKVTVHAEIAGGGFGRRLEHDFAVEAALIANAVGKPVKTIWPREVELRAGYYRPAIAARVRLALGADHLPTAVRVDMAGPSVLEYSGVTNGPPVEDFDWTMLMGWLGRSYAIPHFDTRWKRVDRGVPCGYWRSVGNSQNSFFLECTLDLAARVASLDPLEYRRRLLAGNARAIAFIDALAARARWEEPLPSGHFRGLALNEANNTISGHIVEVEVPSAGHFKLARITAAIDPGVVANPNGVEAQMIGGTVFGLSAALFGEITFKSGQVEQGNFDKYRLMTLAQMPPIDVLVLANGTKPGGVGEEGPSSIGPAVANALYAASGKAVTRLPLHRAGWRSVT
jgi:isoquinoline 1-oxidoreductase subunit beta